MSCACETCERVRKIPFETKDYRVEQGWVTTVVELGPREETNPNMTTCSFRIKGTAPYAQHRLQPLCASRPRSPADPYEAKDGGWYGIPSSAIRAALVQACSLSRPKTVAKLNLHVISNGYDKIDGVQLVRFTKGKPQSMQHGPRTFNAWNPGWEADLQIRFNEDVFSAQEVKGFLKQAGQVIGIGAWRPGGPVGTKGWGTFEVST